MQNIIESTNNWESKLDQHSKKGEWDKIFAIFGEPESIRKNNDKLWNDPDDLYKLAISYGHLAEMNVKLKKDSSHIEEIARFLNYEYNLLNRCLVLKPDNISYLAALAYRHYRLAQELLTCSRPKLNLNQEVKQAHSYFDRILTLEPEHAMTLYRKANLILNVEIPSIRYKNINNKIQLITELEKIALTCQEAIYSQIKAGNQSLKSLHFKARYQQAVYFLEKNKLMENSGMLHMLYFGSPHLTASRNTIEELYVATALLENLWIEAAGCNLSEIAGFHANPADYAGNSFGIHIVTYRLAQSYSYQFLISTAETETAKNYSDKAYTAYQSAQRLFKEAGIASDYVAFKYAKQFAYTNQPNQALELIRNRRAFYMKELLLLIYALLQDKEKYFQLLKDQKNPSHALNLATCYMHFINGNTEESSRICKDFSNYEMKYYINHLNGTN